MTINAKDITMKAVSGGLLTQPDNVPDQFTFVDQSNVPVSSLRTSAPVVITGMDSFAQASISTNIGQYSINAGPFTSAAGICVDGDSIRARHTSSASNSMSVNQTVTIGGVQDVFTTTTEATQSGNALFSSTFNYPQACTIGGHGGGADCAVVQNDGVDWSWGNSGPGGGIAGNFTEVTLDANMPHGGGGMGFRSWVADGVNSYTDVAALDFGVQKPELWWRWYQRYQQGFQWSGGNPQYDKTLYIYSIGFGQGGGWVLPQHGGNGQWSLTILGSVEPYQAISIPAITWSDIFGATSDGEWHLFEIHIKMDSAASNGIGTMWIDGNRVIHETDVNYSGGDSATRNGWRFTEFHHNQASPSNGGNSPMYVDYDDMEIYDTIPPNIDSHGDPWIGPINNFRGGPLAPSMIYTEIHTETVEDNNFAARGWTDNTSQIFTTDTPFGASQNAIDWTWTAGQTTPPSGASMRYNMTPTDSVYLSYWIKLSSNWIGSAVAFHPHVFWFLTNKDAQFAGPFGSELTLYSEMNGPSGLTPRLAFANPANVNGVFYDGNTDFTVNTWHKIEAFFKLNTMTGTVGNNDGIFKCWLDGNLITNVTNAMVREGAANTDMLIDQLGLAPYIQPLGGGGSPVTQSMFIDQVILGTE